MKRLFPYSVVLLLFVLATTGCVAYKRVSMGNAELFTNKHVQENFENYHVYVLAGDHAYRLNNPRMVDNSIAGEAESVTSPEDLQVIQGNKKVRGKNPHKYDLVIHTKNPAWAINDASAANQVSASGSIAQPQAPSTPVDAKRVQLQANEIASVEMYAQNEAAVGLIVLWIVLGFLVVALLIWGLVLISVAGSNDSADASGNSSDSNSDSNSDSPGSDSDSGGSCYIATMVYGSYDAPEVMVLRRFRDQFLAKHYLGRRFIDFYYRTSPKFVKRFQHHDNVHKPIRFALNKLVRLLSKKY